MWYPVSLVTFTSWVRVLHLHKQLPRKKKKKKKVQTKYLEYSNYLAWLLFKVIIRSAEIFLCFR